MEAESSGSAVQSKVAMSHFGKVIAHTLSDFVR